MPLQVLVSGHKAASLAASGCRTGLAQAAWSQPDAVARASAAMNAAADAVLVNRVR